MGGVLLSPIFHHLPSFAVIFHQTSPNNTKQYQVVSICTKPTQTVSSCLKHKKTQINIKIVYKIIENYNSRFVSILHHFCINLTKIRQNFRHFLPRHFVHNLSGKDYVFSRLTFISNSHNFVSSSGNNAKPAGIGRNKTRMVIPFFLHGGKR